MLEVRSHPYGASGNRGGQAGIKDEGQQIDEAIFKAVIREIAETREREEIGCDECYEALDSFVTLQLAGLDTAEAMPLVQEHLHVCGECREEFEALLTALRATGEA